VRGRRNVSPEKMKEQLCRAIDKRGEEIKAIGRDIFAHPELGYREHRTSDLVQRTFAKLGIDYQAGISITGVRGELKGKASLARVAVLGELDGLICPEHPFADPNTGAAHACGHNAQIASMLGLAMALKDTDLMAELWGDVVFMAVPAEEGVEAEYKRRLLAEGKIKFSGGKQNFIAQGQFDDIDLAMLFHSGGDDKKVKAGGTCNGFIKKFVHYKGREAHAGGSPHDGINALNAALLGLMSIHAQRETFRDEDHIRIHPIIIKGGDAVNVVPSDVRIDLQVRGATFPAIIDASRKVDRALQAGAVAIGAEVEITNLPGYMPRVNCPELIEIFMSNAKQLFAVEEIGETGHRASSTDVGDLSQLVPTLYPYVNGTGGRFHTKEFFYVDEDLAYLVPAKLLGMTLIDLLSQEAKGALACKASFKPAFNKQTYLKIWEEIVASSN
jgi:amidohydrolase